MTTSAANPNFFILASNRLWLPSNGEEQEEAMAVLTAHLEGSSISVGRRFSVAKPE